MFQTMNGTIEAIQRNDPAFAGRAQSLFLYPGLHILLLHRLCHYLHRKRLRFAARLLSQVGRLFTNIEIHPGAEIARGVFIDHGAGVVVGETAVVGEGCLLYHGVTLGGTGKETGKRHPTLGRNVVVGAGAKVLGNIHIGDSSRIAANSVVLKDVPAGATVAGVPARVVRLNGKPVVHKEDRIDLEELQREIGMLRERVEALEGREEDTVVVAYPCACSPHSRCS